MTKEQLIFKQLAKCSSRPLSNMDRKLIKQILDKSETTLEVITSIFVLLSDL